MGVVWVYTKYDSPSSKGTKEEEIPYPLHTLYTDPNDFIQDALTIVRLPSYGTVITLSSTALIVPLVLNEIVDIPRTPKSEEIPFEGVDRLRRFLKLMRQPEEYSLLAVPEKTNAKKRVYTGVFPFLKIAQREYVDLFLKSVQFPPDVKSVKAGIYTPQSIIPVDITTREIMRTEPQEIIN